MELAQIERGYSLPLGAARCASLLLRRLGLSLFIRCRSHLPLSLLELCQDSGLLSQSVISNGTSLYHFL